MPSPLSRQITIEIYSKALPDSESQLDLSALNWHLKTAVSVYLGSTFVLYMLWFLFGIPIFKRSKQKYRIWIEDRTKYNQLLWKKKNSSTASSLLNFSGECVDLQIPFWIYDQLYHGWEVQPCGLAYFIVIIPYRKEAVFWVTRNSPNEIGAKAHWACGQGSMSSMEIYTEMTPEEGDFTTQAQ